MTDRDWRSLSREEIDALPYDDFKRHYRVMLLDTHGGPEGLREATAKTAQRILDHAAVHPEIAAATRIKLAELRGEDAGAIVFDRTDDRLKMQEFIETFRGVPHRDTSLPGGVNVFPPRKLELAAYGHVPTRREMRAVRRRIRASR